MPGARRGGGQFVGESEALKPGYWVGVQFDEPLGRNDGSVKGVKLFDCPANHGAFVLGKNITCGDFPERDLLADDDEDEETDGAQGGAADEDEI
jgi:tubulin-folding cofactor B